MGLIEISVSPRESADLLYPLYINMIWRPDEESSTILTEIDVTFWHLNYDVLSLVCSWSEQRGESDVKP